jgi:predicted  nucleic acid-binding Zn-ribbon protein
LQQELKKLSLEIDDYNKKFKELEYEVKEVMVQHQNSYKNCNDLKANAVKVSYTSMYNIFFKMK